VYSKWEDGKFWIKVDGVLDLAATQVASVWKEGDLYHEWFPMCSWSKIFHQPSEAEIVFSYGGQNPMGKSESILRGWGCDHLVEGFFLILGGSVTEWEGERFPPPPRWTTRNVVPVLSILVEPVGRESVRNVMVCALELPPLPGW
jgi:hypothetical protein